MKISELRFWYRRSLCFYGFDRRDLTSGRDCHSCFSHGDFWGEYDIIKNDYFFFKIKFFIMLIKKFIIIIKCRIFLLELQ